MAFFDTSAATSDLLHALREEALAYQEAVSDKLGSFVQGVACFVGAMVRGAHGWGGLAATLVCNTLYALHMPFTCPPGLHRRSCLSSAVGI
jgi:hypothetical protein